MKEIVIEQTSYGTRVTREGQEIFFGGRVEAKKVAKEAGEMFGLPVFNIKKSGRREQTFYPKY